MERDRNNSGVLFKNDRKEKDTHPDYTGNVTVDNTDYWLSAWVKTNKNGGKFFSLALKPKQEPKSNKTIREDVNDEIPF